MKTILTLTILLILTLALLWLHGCLSTPPYQGPNGDGYNRQTNWLN